MEKLDIKDEKRTCSCNGTLGCCHGGQHCSSNGCLCHSEGKKESNVEDKTP